MLRQTEKQWVSSPLGNRLLLALLGNENPLTKKYVQIDKFLKNKVQFKTKNNLFYSDQNNIEYEKYLLKIGKKINFKNSEKSLKQINSMVDNVHYKNYNFEFIKPEMTLLLTNFSSYEDRWNKTDTSGSIMKVHNTFNYTEDIRYETRLLEVPMSDKDFKLVIIIPNEMDVLSNLFNTLYNEGLTAAIKSIQPLFTSVQKLNVPSIEFECKSDVKSFTGTELAIAECGNVKTCDNKISINVMTYVFPSNAQDYQYHKLDENLPTTFYFGLVFRDVPIFTGKYVGVKKV